MSLWRLKRSGLGLLNHLLAGIEIYLYAAIFLTAGSGRVVGYGIGLAHTLDRLDLGRRYAAAQQIAGYALSALLRQVQVLLVACSAVEFFHP